MNDASEQAMQLVAQQGFSELLRLLSDVGAFRP